MDTCLASRPEDLHCDEEHYCLFFALSSQRFPCWTSTTDTGCIRCRYWCWSNLSTEARGHDGNCLLTWHSKDKKPAFQSYTEQAELWQVTHLGINSGLYPCREAPRQANQQLKTLFSSVFKSRPGGRDAPGMSSSVRVKLGKAQADC